jgi:hypothetical protein
MNEEPFTQLPANLPVREDDSACAHLLGPRLADLSRFISCFYFRPSHQPPPPARIERALRISIDGSQIILALDKSPSWTYNQVTGGGWPFTNATYSTQSPQFPFHITSTPNSFHDTNIVATADGNRNAVLYSSQISNVTGVIVQQVLPGGGAEDIIATQNVASNAVTVNFTYYSVPDGSYDSDSSTFTVSVHFFKWT